METSGDVVMVCLVWSKEIVFAATMLGVGSVGFVVLVSVCVAGWSVGACVVGVLSV